MWLAVCVVRANGRAYDVTMEMTSRCASSHWVGDSATGHRLVLALDLEGVHDVKLHHPSSSVATSNQ